MPTFVVVLLALGIVLALPVYNRIVDQPDHWANRPITEHTRRGARWIRARWHVKHPPRGHVHQWHHIALCKCGIVHTIPDHMNGKTS